MAQRELGAERTRDQHADLGGILDDQDLGHAGRIGGSPG
jgi:hypothetical protein